MFLASQITLSRLQVACIVANSFFCTFERLSAQRHWNEFASINMDELFESSFQTKQSRIAKLCMILHYFERLSESVPDGTITFARQCLIKPMDWAQCNSGLCNVQVHCTGVIEDAKDCLQADFANKYIGYV